eukprot:NODE_8667_length_658_cov_26.317757_g8042_i0.p1 GENE.NODE_8667_length_658_cov_26.317757_g8042_i0~~NODE_8667_length_658_cov_26.317757_g8042_i0.p1  ORF type:complete len:171 (+),score=28.81 NODE_8667_length_658_cov_26.317757_g8042_i0:88-600(+)
MNESKIERVNCLPSIAARKHKHRHHKDSHLCSKHKRKSLETQNIAAETSPTPPLTLSVKSLLGHPDSPPLQVKDGGTVDSLTNITLNRSFVGVALPRFLSVYNPAFEPTPQSMLHSVQSKKASNIIPKEQKDYTNHRKKDWISSYMENWFQQSRTGGVLLRGSMNSPPPS